MNDLEAEMVNGLSTIDRVFKVELLKMPPSLQNTLIGELISGSSPRTPSAQPDSRSRLDVSVQTMSLFPPSEAEVGASDVSIAMKVS